MSFWSQLTHKYFLPWAYFKKGLVWQVTSWLVREQQVTSSAQSCFTKYFARLVASHFSMTSVASQVVEERTGKMATANKLALLQRIKQEKDVLFGSYFNNLVTQEKWKVEGSDQACRATKTGCDSNLATCRGRGRSRFCGA